MARKVLNSRVSGADALSQTGEERTLWLAWPTKGLPRSPDFSNWPCREAGVIIFSKISLTSGDGLSDCLGTAISASVNGESCVVVPDEEIL